MRRFLPFALCASLLIGAVAARADWPSGFLTLKQGVRGQDPGAPNKLTAVAAGEVHQQLSGKGVCVRVSCTVSSAYLTGASSSPPTATTDSNQLPATAVERFCLSPTNDYISLYLTSAGSCYVAELSAP